MNGYARLAEVKADTPLAASSSDARDETLLRLIEAVSRATDEHTNRRFYSETATRYFDGPERVTREMWLPTWSPLLTVSSFMVDDDQDGTYELTLAANTDYVLQPRNRPPYEQVRLNPNGTQLFRWPVGWPDALKITGTWGYSAAVEAVTLLNGALTDSATTATVDPDHGITPGDTLYIGTEQLDVTAVNANTLTVTRAINGTTAASALDNATVSRRVFPAVVRQAVTMQVARLFKRRESMFANVLNNTDLGTVTMFRGLDPDIQAMLGPLRQPVMG